MTSRQVRGCLLLMAGTGTSQTPWSAQYPRFLSTHSMQSNGRIRETVTNHEAADITAFRIRFHCPSHPEIFYYYDSAVSPSSNPAIPNGASRSMELPEVPSGCSMDTDAVVFADGTAYGGNIGTAYAANTVQDSLDGVRARRVAYLAELYGLEPVVAEAVARRMTMDAVVKWLKDRNNEIDADATRSNEDRGVCGIAIRSLLAEIGKQHMIQPMVPHSYEVRGLQDVNILDDSVRALRVNEWLQQQKVSVLRSLASQGVPQLRSSIGPPLQ